MSFDAFLNEICTITRDKPVGEDRYNNQATTPTVVGTNVRCRKTQKSMRQVDPLTGEYGFVNVDLILLPRGTDVLPKDKIALDGQTWKVQERLKRQAARSEHHVSVIVEALNAQT